LKILQSSGKHLERQAQKSLGLAVLCILAASILVLISFPLPTRIDLGDYEAAFVLAIVFPVLGILYYSRRYGTYRMGVEGETRVTQVLASKLSDDYYLVNDVARALSFSISGSTLFKKPGSSITDAMAVILC